MVIYVNAVKIISTFTQGFKLTVSKAVAELIMKNCLQIMAVFNLTNLNECAGGGYGKFLPALQLHYTPSLFTIEH